MAALYLILSHPKRGFLINDVREYVSVEIGSIFFLLLQHSLLPWNILIVRVIGIAVAMA
jgi:hypothetical protein